MACRWAMQLRVRPGFFSNSIDMCGGHSSGNIVKQCLYAEHGMNLTNKVLLQASNGLCDY